MKKVLLTVIFLLSSSALYGCHTPSAVSEQALTPMQQSYRGLLPAADNQVRDSSLYLARNGTFILQSTPASSGITAKRLPAQTGHWVRTADKLILAQDDNGGKLIFRPRGTLLEKVNQGGVAPADLQQQYVLSPARQAVSPG